MKFTKSIIASILGATLAFSVAAAEKQHQMITIKAENNGPAEVTISQGDNVEVFLISAEALNDKELLQNELSGISEEQAEHISQALTGLHGIGAGHIKIELDDEQGSEHQVQLHKIVKKFHIKGDTNLEKFAFVTVDGDSEQNYEVIVDAEQEVHFDSSADMPFQAIQHLLSKAKLTAEQLDVLQQILDSKR